MSATHTRVKMEGGHTCMCTHVAWVRYRKEQIKEKWEMGMLRDIQIELFELDVKAMFPSLPKDGVWNALRTLLHDLVLAGRRRGRGQGRELRFAINR